jgi:hypothetical protein
MTVEASGAVTVSAVGDSVAGTVVGGLTVTQPPNPIAIARMRLTIIGISLILLKCFFISVSFLFYGSKKRMEYQLVVVNVAHLAPLRLTLN